MSLIATQAATLLLTFMMVAPVAPAAETSAVIVQEVAPAAEMAVEAVQEQPVEPTVQEVLTKVCAARGYDVKCAKALFGMMFQESTNKYNAVGDNGKALGYFQIHYKMHKVSRECATDLTCSAEWSLDYLESNKFSKYPDYAIQCHNGCNADNGYVNRVWRHAANLWDKPMLVKQPSTQVAVIE